MKESTFSRGHSDTDGKRSIPVGATLRGGSGQLDVNSNLRGGSISHQLLTLIISYSKQCRHCLLPLVGNMYSIYNAGVEIVHMRVKKIELFLKGSCLNVYTD